ncbi:hypothetical protein ACIQTT_08105 [Microbacterium sp. NPDC090225]|uniref:hypothetical protein n=1 Tax=Microbacterium sp. NPDC090225 TaxID=3364207 RepID=UPI003813889C
MTEEIDEETVIVTRRDRRRAVQAESVQADAETQSASSQMDAEVHVEDDEAHMDDNEATVVVGRSRPAASDIDEATIVVDRTRGTSSDDDHEPTVVVDRARPASFELDESTVIVDRSGGTAVAPSGLEETIVRPRRGLRRRRNTVFDPPSSLEDTIPRSAVSFERPTEPEPPAIYKPRPAPLVPKAPPAVGGGPASTRVENPALPSVARQGVRRSRATLLTFAGACAVSLAGLVTLGFVVFA